MSNSPKKQSDSGLVQATTGQGSSEPRIDSTGADDENVSHEQLKGESGEEVVRPSVVNVIGLGSGPPAVVCEVPTAPNETENIPMESSSEQSESKIVRESVITGAVSDEGLSKSHGDDQVVPAPSNGSSPIYEAVAGSEFSETPGDLESGLKPVRCKPETSRGRGIVAPTDDGLEEMSGDAHRDKTDVTLRKRGSKVEYVDDLTAGNGGDIPAPTLINAEVNECKESCTDFLTTTGGITLMLAVSVICSCLIYAIVLATPNDDPAVFNDTVNVTSALNQTQSG